MLPPYQHIEEPLAAELQRRGGKARPTDKDSHGRTVYEALADHFGLTKDDLAEVIYEEGVARSKWENMVRWARRKLKDQDRLVPGLHGIWQLK